MSNEEVAVSLPPPSPDEAVKVIVQLMALDDPNDALEFYEQFKKTDLDPEICLWFAVLIEARDNYKEFMDIATPARKKKFDEIFDWFFNEHDEAYMGAFENVCLTLNLEPNAVRKVLIAMTRSYYKAKQLPEIGMEFCKSLDPCLLDPDSMYVSKTAVTLGFDIRYLKEVQSHDAPGGKVSYKIDLPYYVPIKDIL